MENKLIHSNNVIKITPGKLTAIGSELASELSLIANRMGEEKSPFLQDERNKPVSLTPAWEAGNKPNEELNFKGTFFLSIFLFK